MSASFPGDDRPRNRHPARTCDRPGQTFLHIGPQRRVGRQLRRFRSPGSTFGMPLCRAGPILQTATACRSVAPKLSRNRRCRPPDLACNLSHSQILRTQNRKLLSFRQREIPAGKRLCRLLKHCWGHAACLPEPSRSNSLRHTGPNCSILARQTCGDRCPKTASLIPCRHWWSTRRPQRRPTRSIRTTFLRAHCNFLRRGVATTN